MGVSYMGAGTATTVATPATSTPGLPSATGTASGPDDFLLMVWSCRCGNTGNFSVPNTPTGWTLLGNSTNTTSAKNTVYIFGKRVATGEAAPSVTVTNTGTVTNLTMIVQIFAFGGVDLSNPLEVAPVWTDGATGVNSPAITGATSLNADAGAVNIAHKAESWASVTGTAGWVECAEPSTTLGNDAALYTVWKKMPTAAATGTQTVTTTTSTTDTWLGCTFILRAKTGVDAIEEHFEFGTNGATIVANSTSSPAIAINSGSGTGTFSNAQAHRGTMSALINPTAGSHRVKLNSGIPGPIMYTRAYFYITDTTPAAAMRIMECEDYPGTPIGSIALTTAGVIRVQTSGGANIVNSATTMAINTWYRLELCVNVTANTTTARIYTGALLEAVGTNYTDTCQTSVTASVPWAERCLAGAGSTETTNIYVDDFAYSTADWVGPALVIPKRHRLVPGVPAGQSSRW